MHAESAQLCRPHQMSQSNIPLNIRLHSNPLNKFLSKRDNSFQKLCHSIIYLLLNIILVISGSSQHAEKKELQMPFVVITVISVKEYSMKQSSFMLPECIIDTTFCKRCPQAWRKTRDSLVLNALKGRRWTSIWVSESQVKSQGGVVYVQCWICRPGGELVSWNEQDMWESDSRFLKLRVASTEGGEQHTWRTPIKNGAMSGSYHFLINMGNIREDT